MAKYTIYIKYKEYNYLFNTYLIYINLIQKKIQKDLRYKI